MKILSLISPIPVFIVMYLSIIGSLAHIFIISIYMADKECEQNLLRTEQCSVTIKIVAKKDENIIE